MANLRTNNLSGEQGQNAYRGSVLLESASSSRISVTNTTGLDFGTDQFTIEFWIYLLKEAPVNKNIFARSTSASNTTGMIMWFDGNGHLEFDSIHGVSGAVHTGAAIGNHMWHHIAVTRDSSNNTRLYLNGVNKASASSDTSNIVGATNLQIASNIGADGYYNDAYISNFRMVKGTAIYSGTTDFTPPQSELTVVDGTILLCCQDSNDPTQEATDKTVTGFGNLATAGYPETQPKVIPPYGVDAGNAFGGPIQQSTQGYMYFPTGRTEERGRGRAIFGGGQSTSYTSSIQVFNIQSQGNTVEVGELTSARWGLAAAGSATRGLFGGGRTSPGGSGNYLNTIEFVTIANAGNSSDFGDLTRKGSYINALGNETRGIWAGGYDVDNKPATNIGLNTIDFVTIATAGNASDFGDMVRQDGSSDTTFSKFTTANSTRGLLAGGYNSSGEQDEITFITIATTGNASYFGDLTGVSAFGGSGASSSTRGILTVGGTPGPHNRIDFVTIASTGNATDFGDLTLARRYAQGVSNKTRAVFITGYTGSDTNLIDFVTIATTGNATDFGDNDREDNYGNGATSDSHGGLS